jgi:hypothetical protein
MDYKNKIGDGKFPNYYWVFHYDEKMTVKDGEMMPIDDTIEHDGGFLGEFRTYKEALECVNNKAYYPHVIVEDRLSGQVFEQVAIVCSCCGKEYYETYEDIKFTKQTIEAKGLVFS